jgi:tagatose-1,6-bisphosphate aldolase
LSFRFNTEQQYLQRGGIMQNISIGKYRGLQRCSSGRGTFTCLALDHRQNLRRAMNPDDPSRVSDEELTRFKLQVGAALADESTAVLFDPEYSAAQAIAAGTIPKATGLVVALEATGYTGDPNARRAQILPGWSAEKAKKMGADAVKLLAYYHPDAKISAEIEDFVKQAAEDCARQDLMLMLEPLSYPLDPKEKKLSSAEKRYVVTETARHLVSPGVDLLKAEFPLDDQSEPDEAEWSAACTEVSRASNAPWILLSAAVEFETYLRQVTIACNAGASGIAVGRAVWQEAVQMPDELRSEFLQTTARQRLLRLSALCTALARPWTEFFSAGTLGIDWRRDYPPTSNSIENV